MLAKLKSDIATIHWPSRKNLIKDTTTTMIVSFVLASFIAIWNMVIEYGVNWIVSLF